MTSIINIRKARREGARLVIGIAGISGSGKTRTALEIAYGLANFNTNKIGFLDTENRRGSLYADVLRDNAGTIQEFYIGDLEPPFSPGRYVDAILEFQKHGVEVLIIDSVSHEYEGTGGVEEIAATGRPLADWKKAKAEHKRFMNALLQSNMHIVCCIRAREKVTIEKIDGKTVVTPQGVQPITEKNFMFEMTASLMMWNEGQSQQVMKCPEELKPILGRENGYITANDGKSLRDWVDGAVQLNPEVEQARNTLRTITEKGMDALAAAWKSLPAEIRKSINANGCPEELKSAAIAYDKQRQIANASNAAVDDLNSSILGDPND